MAYFGADLVGNFLERLPDSIDRTSSFENDGSSRSRLVLELSLGALVDVTDEVVDRSLELLARSELMGCKGDALAVLSRNAHDRQCRAATNRLRTGGRRGTIAGSVTIDAVGGSNGRLLAPGRSNRNLSTGLDGTESREGLLRRGVEGGLLGRRRTISLLLASGLLAERRIRLGGGRRRMGDVFLIGDVLDGDMVIFVLLHQLLRRGETLGSRAGGCFGCHVCSVDRCELTNGCCVDGGRRSLKLCSHCCSRRCEFTWWVVW